MASEKKEKIRSFLQKNGFETLAILLILAVLAVFAVQKEGFHQDELISYEFANAEFNPWIVPIQPQGRLAKFVQNELRGETLAQTISNGIYIVTDVLQNRGESLLLSYTADVYEEPVWIVRQTFEDYMTVNGTDAFNLFSVYFNVKSDNHPFLHFLALHLVSSIFQGKISALFGCGINICFCLGTLLLLLKCSRYLGELLFAEGEDKAFYVRLLGLLTILSYGLSCGAVATILLIRMYGMLTFFCVCLFWLHVKKWQEGGFLAKNKRLILVTVFGFWTQYFFLFYCLILAAVTALLLFVQKRHGELLRYIGSMVTAAFIGVLGFPFAISHILSSGRGVEAISNLSAGLAGLSERLLSFGGILFNRTPLFVLLFLLVGLEMCLPKKKHAADAALQEQSAAMEEPAIARPQAATFEKRSLLALLLLPPFGYFLLASRMSPYLVDRYIMPLFPFVCLAGVLFLFLLLPGLAVQRKRGLSLAMTGVLLAYSIGALLTYDGAYLYTGYDEQLSLAEAYAAYPCICVYEGSGYYENILEFMVYEETLLVTFSELEERQDKASIEALDAVVVLVKDIVDTDAVTRLLEEQYGLTCAETLLAEGVHGDWIGLFVR